MAVRKNGKENGQQNLDLDDSLESLVNMLETSNILKVKGSLYSCPTEVNIN